MSECPYCRREYEPEARPLTTVAITVRARIAPNDVILRSHIADMVQQAVLEWMHSDTYNSVAPTDEMEDLIDIVIAR